MNYGFQISASGVLTSLYRQDVAANNLANARTVGFKPDVAATRQRPAVREEDGLPNLPSNTLLERLGGGVLLQRNRVTFEQGNLESAGPLDLAFQGDGFFVVRESVNGANDRIRLSRDGRMTRNSDGILVQAGSGMPILDAQNRPIPLPDGPVQVGTDGVIRQGTRELARIRLVSVPDTSRLTKIGDSLFQAPNDAVAGMRPATGIVKQGFVEQAAIDEIKAMMDVTDAGRDVDANLGLIQQQDRMLDRAINTLGRVS
ncbi:MAG: flagellar hook-basal body protein [Planctomycetota bacterium]|jgi:flagellar basal body rod protein FlgG|nr:flagellar hook-basal body protein [Planctomycetota bacterium]